ncbi:AAA family ATPase [Robbsia sp. Bb-Pol-6]|uniref:AAA family ATPase n=2 Tax=Robbsia betulipollinis TaxID=2981849 RepID=A0ABT3ZS66_9BURK|nr:AAA family ATPase [Robbsia betulipollinis]MCY0389391.1 AAA family ATPase [Robbsia betulipollinis]
MKIDRIALAEFRRFREPLVLDGLSDGINLFVGHNEAGKSTIAMAIRAAFLERSRTRTVTDFAPWGTSGARPSVDIDFRIGARTYALRKRFLTRSRCELAIGTCDAPGGADMAGMAGHAGGGAATRLEGEAAEDALAALIGFEFPSKGQSQPKQAGVPGLLWIRQGEGQELVDPAAHAGTHLRDALQRLSGEMASADGDRLFSRVAAERGELLDARLGRPKGIYREAEDALSASRQQVDALRRQKIQFDSDVDQLAQLRAAHQAVASEQPWAAFEAQADAARRQLAAVVEARDQTLALRREQAQAEALQAELHAQVRRDQDEDDALRAQLREAAAQGIAAEEARTLLDDARARHDVRAAALAQARERHAAAQSLAERRDIDAQLATWRREAAQLDATLTEAVRLQGDIEALEMAARSDTRAPSLPADLDALRRVEQTLAECRIRQEAAATRLHYWLDAGTALRLAHAPGEGAADGLAGDTAARAVDTDTASAGGTAAKSVATDTAGAVDATAAVLSGAGERWLTAGTDLHLPGIGRLRIAPGGRDLPELSRQIEHALRARADLLQRLGAESLAAAQVRQEDHARRLRDLDAARKELAIRAPEGPAGVRRALDIGRQREQALVLRRATLPGGAEGGTEGGAEAAAGASMAAGDVSHRLVAQTRLECDAAQTALERALAARTLAEARFNTALATARLLDEQSQARARAHRDALRQQERAALVARLVEARGLADDLRRRGDAVAAALDAQHGELLEQDVQRFERSAAIAREAQQRRHHDILILTGALEQAGASGVGEALLLAEAETEHLGRRRDEIARRADGLQLLWTLLNEKRDAATLRLQAPLVRRLNHYLALLFPGARLQLGDDLLPVDLHRADQQDALHSLSFGTREQLGLLVRLAYADLLREAGRPTLLLLDDALVHADAQRRALIKRALFDAALRHQILMFTCHGEAWQDLGAAQRTVG